MVSAQKRSSSVFDNGRSPSRPAKARQLNKGQRSPSECAEHRPSWTYTDMDKVHMSDGHIEEHLEVIRRAEKHHHSHYLGVRWNDECKKWFASLHANGKHHYCGLYESECDAARAVNAKCGELDIPHKNKGLGTIQIRKKNKRSSRKSAYKGIYWVEKSQSWQVKIKYQKNLHSGGTFQDEYLAAQAANLLCVKLNIPQKNAEIGVSDISEKMKDGKIPPRRPRPRRKKNGANSYLRSPHNIRRQGDKIVQKIVTKKKLPGDLLSVRCFMKNSFKKKIDDPLEPFRNEYMGWKYVGCGTRTMSKIGFPAFFYEMPKSLLDPVLNFMLKEKVLIMSCLFQASSSGSFALVAFNTKFLNKECRTAEIMFFDQKGEGLGIQKNLDLSYLTTIRIQMFVLHKENIENVLKAVLATDLSTSVAYIIFGKFSDYALQTKQQAENNFRENKLMFSQLKLRIKRIIHRGGSPEKRTLNKLKLVQNNMQVLHASISKFDSRLSQIHNNNTILLHELHKEIRKLYNVQAEMYKLGNTDREESYHDLSFYDDQSDCLKRKRQISFKLESLMLRANQNESLFKLACDRLELHLMGSPEGAPQTEEAENFRREKIDDIIEEVRVMLLEQKDDMVKDNPSAEKLVKQVEGFIDDEVNSRVFRENKIKDFPYVEVNELKDSMGPLFREAWENRQADLRENLDKLLLAAEEFVMGSMADIVAESLSEDDCVFLMKQATRAFAQQFVEVIDILEEIAMDKINELEQQMAPDFRDAYNQKKAENEGDSWTFDAHLYWNGHESAARVSDKICTPDHVIDLTFDPHVSPAPRPSPELPPSFPPSPSLSPPPRPSPQPYKDSRRQFELNDASSPPRKQTFI